MVVGERLWNHWVSLSPWDSPLPQDLAIGLNLITEDTLCLYRMKTNNIMEQDRKYITLQNKCLLPSLQGLWGFNISSYLRIMKT